MGLIGGIARTAVVAGTWTAVSNAVSRRQAGRWAAQDQSAQPPSYMPPPPGRYQRPMFQRQRAPSPSLSSTDMSTRIAQLQQLGVLKTQGVLTEAEFHTQKQRILNS